MKNKLMRNLGLKIMALLFSLVLWMIAADINNPMSSRIYSVKVQLVNTASITGQNKTYKVLENSDIIRVTVRAPQSILEDMSEENISARADCSQVAEDGRVPIELNINSDVESARMDKDHVRLDIENKKTKQLGIEVVKNGKLPDGYITGRIVTESNMMSISGPESGIEQVARAVVEVSLDNVTSNIDIVGTIKLLDKEGKEISNTDLKKSIDNVKVTVPILLTKEVPVSWQVTGTPAEGYALTGTVTCTPETVLIAGKESAVNKVENIEIPASETDVTGADESYSAMVDIRQYLPSDIGLGDASFSGYVTLMAEIEPIRKKTVTVTESTIQVLNVPAGWQAEIVQGQGLRLNVSGLQRYLNGLDETAVVPHVDVSALLDAEGNVPAGEQEITVNFLIPQNVKQEGTVKAIIRITKKPEEQ